MDRAQRGRSGNRPTVDAPDASSLYYNPHHRSDRSVISIAALIAVGVHIAVLVANLPDRDVPVLAAEDPGPILVITELPLPPPEIVPAAPRPARERERILFLPDPEPDKDPEPAPEPDPEFELEFDHSDVEIVIDPPPPTSPQAPGPGKPVESDEPVPGFHPGLENPSVIPETKVEPRYPEMARHGRVSGRVILQATIGRDGVVHSVEVAHVSRPGVGFEEAAVEAVLQWRYEPGKLGGRPVPVLLTVRVDFNLR